jgi:hypothetical protein
MCYFACQVKEDENKSPQTRITITYNIKLITIKIVSKYWDISDSTIIHKKTFEV